MNKQLTILILGILVAVVPFLGFPNKWETVMFVAAGLIIALLAFFHDRPQHQVSNNNKDDKEAGVQTESFVENGHFNQEPGVSKISDGITAKEEEGEVKENT